MSVFAQIHNQGLIKWWERHGDNLIASSIKILAIILAYVVIRAVILQVAAKLLKAPMMSGVGEMRAARVRALYSVIRSGVSFVLAFIAVIMVLQACGFDIVPLITTASVAGLAIGFGAQKLVKDVISGFFILIEDQYGVGDFVTIGAASGTVEELGMRTTRLKDNSGKLFIIANGDINQVYNHSRGHLAAWTDVPLAAGADIEKAKSVLNSLGESMASGMPDKIKVAFKCDGLSSIGSEKITVRYAGGVVARHQDEVILKINESIREELTKSGISLG